MYAEQQLLPWVMALRDAVPGLDPFDAHLHVGLRDPAGFQATADEVVDALRLTATRGLVFALKEPAGYRAANGAMTDLAAANPQLLRALCRLDPADDPLGEAQRSLEAGAVGLKLHPRGEDFELKDARLDDVFALADALRLPIMVHAGAGDAGVVDQALERAAAHPGARLILAHCGVGAFGLAVERSRPLANVFFDTAWWNPADVWALLRLVPPGRILYASDVPFAGPGACQILTGRLALEAGLDHAQVRSVMGGQLERLIAREEPAELGPGAGVPEPLAPELERLYVTLCSVVEPMLRGEEPGQGLELARASCADPHGPFEEVLGSVGALLELAVDAEERDALRPLRTPGFDLVLAAAVVARTPTVPVP